MCGNTQVDALRLRLEEKESLLSKKSQQMSELTEEKSTQHGEITDLKDMLDVKERKVNVLQKKARKYLLLAVYVRDLRLPMPQFLSSDSALVLSFAVILNFNHKMGLCFCGC